MQRYWAMVEGIRFDKSIFDTDDLSTIRGGSWALSTLPGSLAPALQENFEMLRPGAGASVVRVYSAASRALYRIDAAVGLEAVRGALAGLLSGRDDLQTAAANGDETRAFLEQWGELARCLVFGHAVMIDAAPESGVLAIEARLAGAIALRSGQSLDIDIPEVLSAAERRARLTRAALAAERSRHLVPDKKTYPDFDLPCLIDRIRPRDGFAWRTRDNEGYKEVPVSRSVESRKALGRTGRRPEFYEDFCGFSGQFGFSDNFEEIASEQPPAETGAGTRNMMAVIYLDGNGFRALRQSEVRTGGDDFEAAKTVSERFSAAWRGLLAGMCALVTAPGQDGLRLTCPSKRRIDGEARDLPVLRFETLMWGGDEALFVFPAWAIEPVLRHLENLVEHGAAGMLLDENRALRAKLTYGIGIVCCNFKTPIREAKRVAELLAEQAKARARDDARSGGRVLASYVDMLVTGGVELPSESLEGLRADLFRIEKPNQGKAFCLPLNGIGALLDRFCEIKGRPGNEEAGVARAKLAALLDRAIKERLFDKSVDAADRKEGQAELRKLLAGSLLAPKDRASRPSKPFPADFWESSFAHAFGEQSFAPLIHLLGLWRLIGLSGDAPQPGGAGQ